MFTSYLPVENFVRILAECSAEECERLMPILEVDPSERDLLRILNREFDLEGKGFNSYGFPYNQSLPDGWDYIVPILNTNYDIFKRFPVNTNRVQGRTETYSIFWNQEKYYERFANSNELPEDFTALMDERLMAGLKLGGWTVLPSRSSGELYVVTKDGYDAPAPAVQDPAILVPVEKASTDPKTDDRIVDVQDDEEGWSTVAAVDAVAAAPVESNKDKVQGLLRNLATEIPLIWNWISEANGSEIAHINVNVRKLLDRRANVDEARRHAMNLLKACSLLTVTPIVKGQERNGFDIVVMA